MNQLSKNPVQQAYLKDLESWAKRNGDDIYDFANQLAALEKFIEAKKAEHEAYYGTKEFNLYLDSARVDWETEIKDPFINP